MIKKILLAVGVLVAVLVAAAAYILTHPPAELTETKGEENHGNQAITAEMTAEQAERNFLEHMIPHHEEAVTSARLAVTKSANPEVKQLAEAIIAAQEKEIANMKNWYRSWYEVEYSTGNYEPMMPDLASLSDNDFDRAFLESMIEHHLQALRQGQTVAPYISHEEIRALVENIAQTQSNEIITMRILLKQL